MTAILNFWIAAETIPIRFAQSAWYQNAWHWRQTKPDCQFLVI